MEERTPVLSRHAKPRKKANPLLLSGLTVAVGAVIATPLIMGAASAEPPPLQVNQLTPIVSAPIVTSTPTPTPTPSPTAKKTLAPVAITKAQVAVEFARKQLGKPYIWGGEGPRGYDCSGLTMMAYRSAGVKIPRTADSQYAAIDKKIKFDDLQVGDLVFFYGDKHHVGIVDRPNHMINASQTGEPIKEESLLGWRRSAFSGAVRPT